MHHLDQMDRVDIITALQEAGVDYVVFNILQMLSLPDLCSVLQVSSAWNSWDTSYLWNRVLVSQLKGREELVKQLQHSQSQKESTQILWNLSRAWRHSDCSTVRISLESSVLSVWSTGVSVLCGMNSGDVEEWGLDGERIRSKEMHEKGIRVLRVVGTKLFTGSYDGTVKVWCSKWFHLRQISLGVAVTDICLDGCSLFVCGDEGRVECYQEQEDKLSLVWRLEGGEMVNCIIVWGSVMVTGGDGGELVARTTYSGEVENTLTGHQRGCGISDLAVGHLGLWSASFDCTVRLWGRQCECLAVLSGHTNPVRCLVVDRSRLVSGDYRGFVMIWDMEDVEQELGSFKKAQKKGRKDKSEGIYFLRGRQVVQNSSGVAEVLQHNSLLEHNGNVTGLALECGTLISGSRDRTLNIHMFGRTLAGTPRKRSSHTRKSYL